MLREMLQRGRQSPDELRALAQDLLDRGLLDDALAAAQRAVQRQENCASSWALLSKILLVQGRLEDAEGSIRRALRIDPTNAHGWVGRASIQNRLLHPQDALASYRQAEALDPRIPLLHLSIGHVLKAMGRRSECERVYKECLARDTDAAAAWWSLADLKNYHFSDAEIDALQNSLGRAGSHDRDLMRLHFALGRACEQRARYQQAFRHYERANRIRSAQCPFDYRDFEANAQRIRACFDRAYFARVRGQGHHDGAPIFIVGMPRSGSTLLEQILASHSCVDGTMELANFLNYVQELDHTGGAAHAYPECVRDAKPYLLEALGRRYIRETRVLRSDETHFIDKMPNNFAHVGLIHAVLPEATIIDVRRHPLDTGLSCYKQYFAAGQAFTADLDGLGKYYRSYLALMDHWDAVLPGKVLHVAYEELIHSPQPQIRRLLAHCGLRFEPACLQFYKTCRTIRSASSEQVRQPLYTSGIGAWRRFERELEPLRVSLGDCLERFPDSAPARRSAPRRQASVAGSRSALGVAVAALTYAGCDPVALADSPADSLEEVIVTARHRAEKLEDVPQNIDVLTSQDLQNSNIVRIEDFALQVPSISLISTGPGGQRLVIRGASDGSDPNFGHSNVSTTGFMIDDLSFSFFGHDPDLHLVDINRIEILNGPQGTLSGPGALSGTVHIITNKPDPREYSAAAHIEAAQIAGGTNNETYEGTVNLPLIEDTTALRASLYSVHEGGYINNVLASRQWANGVTSSNGDWAGRHQNTRNILGGRIALQHSFSDEWLVRLTGYYQQQRYAGSWEEDPTNVGARALRRFSPQGGYNYGRFVELHAEGDVGIADLIYTGGYSYQKSRRLYDFSDYVQYYYALEALTCQTDPASGPGEHGCKAPYMFGQVDSVTERFSNELRLQSRPGGNAHWVVGGYWEKTRDPYSGFQHLPNINFQGEAAQSALAGGGASPLPEEFYSDFATSNHLQTSAFANLANDLNTHWSVEGGIQHFHSSSSDYTYWAGYFSDPKIPIYRSAAASATNFKASLSYRPAAHPLLYFDFAQGFRDGGFNYLAPDFANPAIPRYYRPDTLENFELGWKTQFLDGRLRWSGALYYMPWKKYQVQVSIPTPPYAFGANVGDARVYGIESSLEWQPLAGLHLSLTGNYNDARLVSDAFQGAGFHAVPGERLPEAPLFNFNAIGRYEWQLRAGMQWYAQADVAYKGSMWNDLRIDQRTLQPAYTLANLRFGANWSGAAWNAEAFVTNVGNSNAVLFVNATGYDTFAGVSNPVIAVAPRTYGLRVTYRWRKGR